LSSGAVAATFINPFSGNAEDEELKNWAGNITYSTKNLANPGSLTALESAIRQYPNFKVLGTRHCFNTIADSRNQFVSVRDLDIPIRIDKEKFRVSVGAGIRYGTLAEYLEKNGFALHNLASLPHISIAGACLTATHGSGVKNKNLSSAVAEMDIIDASGKTHMLSREKNPDQLNGAVVNLGALGVITRVSLDIQPSYQVGQWVYENLSFDTLRDHFDQIMGAGYSVSLFTDWRNKNCSEVWVKSKLTKTEQVKPMADFYGAKPASRNLHPIVELSAENCTDQMGLPGPWHERLPHFKMGFTPSSGKELQAEYFVPREHSYEAIMAVEKLHEQISPHLLITEIRTIDADEFWMSPCYRQPSTTIHFTWKPEWPDVKKLLPQIESALSPFNAKPHWGKLFAMKPAVLRSRYTRYQDFVSTAREFDPNGKFRNDFLNQNVFE